jgi:glycerol-3-phosphate dehydrogenase
MAEDCIDQTEILAKLPEKECVTKTLKIHGYLENSEELNDLAIYGADAAEINKIVEAGNNLSQKLHNDLPYTEAEVIWAVRNEMARTIEDVLARRTRSLFLNAKAAIEIAPKVADIMAKELAQNEKWKAIELQAFQETAKNYLAN